MMKKNLLYLMALITVIFASCDPLEKTYEEIENNNFVKKGMAITLESAYPTVDGAKTEIEKLLNTSYAQLSEGSTANVTYNSTATLPAQVKPADSVLSNTVYTITDEDYAAVNKNTFKNFSAAKVLEFLVYKYPAPVANQLQALNYVYFESGATPSAGIPAADSFLYLNGAWVKVYQVTPAQYTSVGRGSYGNFSLGDEASLNGFFNAFLKGDAAVSSSAKPGHVRYVSYVFYNSSSRVTSRRVRPLVFDGMNWAYKAIPATNTLGFVKKGGKWIADPTVYYTLTTADYTNIGNNSNVGGQASRDNLKSYNNFNLAANQASVWSVEDVNKALIYLLGVKYPNAPVDPTVEYNLTFAVYRPPTGTDTRTFVKAATGFVVVVKP